MLDNDKDDFENKVTKLLSKKITTNPVQLSKEEKEKVEKRTKNIKSFINTVITAKDERFTEDSD